jgi:metal-dependent hydrolase (beta-lactamase superfamily II)
LGQEISDVSARVDYAEDQELDIAIKKTRHDVKDVNGVIMSHLHLDHLDHAGSLEYFRDTDVAIYAHELEIKNSFYSVATKTDISELFRTNWKIDLLANGSIHWSME